MSRGLVQRCAAKVGLCTDIRTLRHHSVHVRQRHMAKVLTIEFTWFTLYMGFTSQAAFF